MPDCVEKTLTGLIIHFEKSIIEDYDPSEILIDEVIKSLDEQIKQQDLLSEDIKEGLQKLKLSLQSNDSISIIGNLRDILKKSDQ